MVTGVLSNRIETPLLIGDTFMDNVGYDLSWITVTPDGTSVYLTAVYANSMFSFDRNTETGALSGKCLTKSYMSTTDLIARNLAMSPDSKHMYTGNTNHGIVKFDRQANTPWPSTTEKKWPSFFGDKGEPICGTEPHRLPNNVPPSSNPDNKKTSIPSNTPPTTDQTPSYFRDINRSTIIIIVTVVLFCILFFGMLSIIYIYWKKNQISMVKQQQRNETTWEDIDMNGVELVANPLDEASVEDGGKPKTNL